MIVWTFIVMACIPPAPVEYMPLAMQGERGFAVIPQEQCGWDYRGQLYATEALCQVDGQDAVKRHDIFSDVADGKYAKDYRCAAHLVRE